MQDIYNKENRIIYIGIIIYFLLLSISAIFVSEYLYLEIEEQNEIHFNFNNDIFYSEENKLILKNKNKVDTDHILYDTEYLIQNFPMVNSPLDSSSKSIIEFKDVPNKWKFSFSQNSVDNKMNARDYILFIISKDNCNISDLLHKPLCLGEGDIKSLITIGENDYYWDTLSLKLGIKILLKYDPYLTNTDFSFYIDFLISEYNFNETFKEYVLTLKNQLLKDRIIIGSQL